jgi:LPXTG-motif cell wall-anchored protein
MKKLRLALAVAVVAFFTVIAPSPAQTYPALSVTVTESTVVGGNEITITAVVVPAVDCESWELTFMGDTRTGSGPSITETFDTPEVDEVEEHDAVATCTWDDPHPGPGPDDNAAGVAGGGGAGTLGAVLGTSLAQVLVQATGTGTQTLLPLDDDDDDDGNGGGDDGDGGGILPNTGGERLAWLVIGGMLVLVGAGVVVASRRRDA